MSDSQLEGRGSSVYPGSIVAWLLARVAAVIFRRYGSLTWAEYFSRLGARLGPDIAKVRYIHGWMLFDLERYEEALAELEAATQLNENYALAWCTKSHVLLRLGRYKKAMTAAVQAIDLFPDYHSAWYVKGTALYHLKHYDEAVYALDRGLRSEKRDTDMLSTKGWALFYQRKYEPALTVANEILVKSQ